MSKNNFISLLKKEVLEQFRNSKTIVFLVVFFFFGLMSPISAMFMPEIIAGISESQNISIILPEPTWIDAVGQYVKNISQMASFIIILVYMGVIAKEKETGTIVFLLVKPVKRSSFILSKYTSVFITAFLGIFVAFLASSFYTYLFFENFDVLLYLKINLIMFLYVLSVLFITVFFSSIFKSQIVAGVFAFGLYLLFNLLPQIGNLGKFFPGGLLDQTTNLILGKSLDVEVFISTGMYLFAFIIVSVVFFRKWEP